MKKIAIIGAGNVGGLAAMRILENNLGEVVLVDVAKNLASAKAFDLEDAKAGVGTNYCISSTDDFSRIAGSDIVVVTAGLARRTGMLREELLEKNAKIIQDVAQKIKIYAQEAICIVVTNPVDIMTYLFIRELGQSRERIFGMGINLDIWRFANLISKKFKKDISRIKPVVLGVHGQGMIPLSRLTLIDNKPLNQLAPDKEIRQLEEETVLRGARIVSLYGSGSAYFAPSAAISAMIKAIIHDSNQICGASVLLKGEFDISDVCLGVLVRLGKNGIGDIVKFDLTKEEISLLQRSAEAVRSNIKLIAKKT